MLLPTYVSDKGVKVVFFNVSDAVAKALTKYGIRNDRSSQIVNLDQFLFKAGNILLVPEVLIRLLQTQPWLIMCYSKDDNDDLEISPDNSFTLIEAVNGEETEVKIEC